jgi:transposase-like protein
MPHTVSDPPITTCPVCGSDGADIRHDIRCSLLYRCERCNHEWQIDFGEEPPKAAPQWSGSPRTVAACSKPSHNS